MSFGRKLLTVLTIAAAVFATACGSDYLKSDSDVYEEERGFTIDEEAQIPDTTTNRQVLDVLLQYRQALIKKDIGALQRLISEDYYDNGGTTDTTRDDWGKSQLGEIFEVIAQKASEIQYEVKVKELEVDGDRAWVDYEYKYAYQYKVGDQSSWDAGLDVNRLELESRQGQWKILSGL